MLRLAPTAFEEITFPDSHCLSIFRVVHEKPRLLPVEGKTTFEALAEINQRFAVRADLPVAAEW
jgi:hypothetical protein